MRRLRSVGSTVCFPISFCWSHDPDNEFYPTDTGHNREQIQRATIRCLVDNGYLNDKLGFVGGQWEGLKLTKNGFIRA